MELAVKKVENADGGEWFKVGKEVWGRRKNRRKGSGKCGKRRGGRMRRGRVMRFVRGGGSVGARNGRRRASCRGRSQGVAKIRTAS